VRPVAVHVSKPTRQADKGKTTSPSGARPASAPAPAPASSVTPAAATAQEPAVSAEPSAPAGSTEGAGPDSRAIVTPSEQAVDSAELEEDNIRFVVLHHLPQVQSCYERALKAGGVKEGQIEIAFTLQADGHATGAHVVANDVGSDELGGCVAHLVESWTSRAPSTLPSILSTPSHLRVTTSGCVARVVR
jgi:hypothetical protein